MRCSLDILAKTGSVPGLQGSVVPGLPPELSLQLWAVPAVIYKAGTLATLTCPWFTKFGEDGGDLGLRTSEDVTGRGWGVAWVGCGRAWLGGVWLPPPHP